MATTHNFGTAIRIAWRELARRPGISIAAWLALALGIALNTAMFSGVNGFLLRPLPVDDIDSVVRVREVARGNGAEPVFSMSPASFEAWHENNAVFSGMAAATGQAVTWTGAGEAERLQAAVVTANFFDVLGIGALHGRTFAAREDVSGSNDVVLLSHAVWEQRFGARDDAVGRVLVLDGRPHTVIGVMPRGLRHPYEAEVWIPFAFDELLRSPSGNFLYVPARFTAANGSAVSCLHCSGLRPLVALLDSYFYGVSFGAAGAVVWPALLLWIAAAMAAWLPARRAARVNPVDALRDA